MALPDPTDMSTDDMVRELYSAVDNFLEVAVPVIGEIKPTLDALTANPMVKMLLGKKG